MCCKPEISLCYTNTCYGIDECIASCWCIGGSKNKDSTLHFQAERTQIQWRWPSLGCCFHEDCNIMAFRICINRFWLVGGKAIILIDFPFYTCIVGANPLPWMLITTQTKYCTVSMRSAWVSPISPNAILKSWTDTLQKSVQSWYIPFALQVWYHIRSNEMSACLSTEGTWQGGSCIQIWCTGSFSPIHHLKVSLGANFVEYRSRQTKIHIAIKHLDDIVFFWCSL